MLEWVDVRCTAASDYGSIEDPHSDCCWSWDMAGGWMRWLKMHHGWSMQSFWSSIVLTMWRMMLSRMHLHLFFWFFYLWVLSYSNWPAYDPNGQFLLPVMQMRLGLARMSMSLWVHLTLWYFHLAASQCSLPYGSILSLGLSICWILGQWVCWDPFDFYRLRLQGNSKRRSELMEFQPLIWSCE